MASTVADYSSNGQDEGVTAGARSRSAVLADHKLGIGFEHYHFAQLKLAAP
jgi:hypothetical protein